MARESCVFYKSFYESIKELEPECQAQIYNAIFSYQFNDEKIELQGVAKSIFTLILPLLESNNKKYENGKKGGRPKTKKNQNETKTKPNDNQSLTQCIMYNDKCIMNNDITTSTSTSTNINNTNNSNINIYDYIEINFGRTLSPIEYEEVEKWEDSDLTRYAISQAILNGKYNLKYISRILDNYKKNGIITIQQAQEEEEKFKSGIKKNSNELLYDKMNEWAKKAEEREKNDNK